MLLLLVTLYSKKKNVLNFRWYFYRTRQDTTRESAEKYVTRKVRSLSYTGKFFGGVVVRSKTKIGICDFWYKHILFAKP